MKIVHVTNNYHPYKGGVVQSIDAIVQTLQSKGHEVYIVTLNFSGDHSDDPAHVIRLPSLLRFKWKANHMAYPQGATKHVQAIFDRIDPDVVHIHHPFLLGPVALKCAQKRYIKTIFTYHTQYEKYSHYVPFFPQIVQHLTKVWVNRMCDRVDTIIAPSSGVKKMLSSYQQKKCVVLPSPIRDCFFTTRNARRKPGKVVQLLSVSRFAKEKNLELLLELMVRLPSGYQLTLAGYGHHLASLKHYAFEELGLQQSRVTFIDQPDQVRLVKLYQTSDIFLFSSSSDTQGLVLAEAMAAGLPVVSVHGVGQQDIVKNGYNGYLVKGASGMKAKILALSRAQGALRLGALHTASMFQSENIVDRLCCLYRGENRNSIDYMAINR